MQPPLTSLLRRLRADRGGFSLLEVMVAVAILGLALTVILSAQGGLSASHRSAAHIGFATSLARCKMTELEENLLKLGYPELETVETGSSCCADSDLPAFTCDFRVEKVELPNPPSADGGAGLDLGGDGGIPGLPPELSNPAGGGALNLSLDAGLAGLGTTLQSGVGGAGGAGLLNMVMGLVYPTFKPLFETSIRRLTVVVRWKEGPTDKEFTIVQYVTNPQRGGFLAGVPTGDGGVPLSPLGGAVPGAGSVLGGGGVVSPGFNLNAGRPPQ